MKRSRIAQEDGDSVHGVGELARTLEILSPTVRMDAIAATAINDKIRVYSRAMAPR